MRFASTWLNASHTCPHWPVCFERVRACKPYAMEAGPSRDVGKQPCATASPPPCAVQPNSASHASTSTNCPGNDAPDPSPAQVRQEVWRVLLLAPNIIGYARLMLAGTAWVCAGPAALPGPAAALFLASFCLDAVDGAVARRYNQASAFGAWLDVWVDNLSRGCLWVLACPHGLGLLAVMLEMSTFLATFSAGGAGWKQGGVFAAAPPWVELLMGAHFRTPLGALMVLGLMGCPMWLWARSALPALPLPWAAVGCVVVAGRLLAAAVEVWVLHRFLLGLLVSNLKEL
ncbi:CDP-alcohol phosphatidyltransferase-domain-containing protein [Haematococcus lacustris]